MQFLSKDVWHFASNKLFFSWDVPIWAIVLFHCDHFNLFMAQWELPEFYEGVGTAQPSLRAIGRSSEELMKAMKRGGFQFLGAVGSWSFRLKDVRDSTWEAHSSIVLFFVSHIFGGLES